MSRRYTAVHEAGHAFFWFYAGVQPGHAKIWQQNAMGDDEWEGDVNPGDYSQIDRIYAIMALYAGGLAEVKLCAQDSVHGSVNFDYGDPEQAFIEGRVTQEPTVLGVPGKTAVSFIECAPGQAFSEFLATASFSGDVRQARTLANAVGRPDVLVPQCRRVRQLLDLPAIWYSVQRFAHKLEETNSLLFPVAGKTLSQLFEEESALEAHRIWLARECPLWDDQADWFAAQGVNL